MNLSDLRRRDPEVATCTHTTRDAAMDLCDPRRRDSRGASREKHPIAGPDLHGRLIARPKLAALALCMGLGLLEPPGNGGGGGGFGSSWPDVSATHSGPQSHADQLFPFLGNRP